MHSYKDTHNATYKIWKKFMDTGQIDEKCKLPHMIEESWIRSREHGVDPYIKRNKFVLRGHKLNDLLEENKELINLSKPFLENLYSFVKGSGFVVTLFDSVGYILDIIGDEDAVEQIKKVDFTVGSLWSEKSVGTSAIGLTVNNNSPVQVRSSEHYYKHGHGITGSGAPIHNLSGKLLGGVTIFGPEQKANPHTLGMVVAAAHAITYYIRATKAHAKINLSNNFRKAVIETIPEALIVLNPDYLIELTNEKAKAMLDLPADCVGKHIENILGRGNELFLNQLARKRAFLDEEVRITRNGKTNAYTMTSNTALCSERKEDMGKVIILNELSRAKTLVNKMVGARAKFKFTDIIGEHPLSIKSLQLGKKAAQTASNVLLLGESGTGKNIFAQAIHNESSRANGPFVSVNCAAIPRELIASELFGYSEGAFTGSKKGGNPGKFELADGGTICLDEIGEMPLDLQTTLLSVLEERAIVRVGGREVIPVNVRIIATTNRNLKEAIEKGMFRADLYYRLNVITIEMAPLRKRTSDIILFAQYFVSKLGSQLNIRNVTIHKEVLNILSKYSWPGNVREVQNVIERCLNIISDNEITLDVLPSEILGEPVAHTHKFEGTKRSSEYKLIMELLNSDLSKTKIADKLNISRCTLYRKLKQYGIHYYRNVPL